MNVRLALAPLLAGACLMTLSGCREEVPAAFSPELAAAPPPSPVAAAELRVSCTPAGISVAGAAVAAGRAGVRLRVSSTAAKGTYLNSTWTGGGGGDPVPQAPAAPGGLSAVTVSASQINLNWQDNASNENGFRIERKTANSDWSEIGTVGANATAYSNPGSSAGTTYFYRVFAVNNTGASAPSNEASASTGVVSNNTSAAATFVSSDENTHGNWKGVYGNEGYNIIANSVSYPGYVTVNPSGKDDYQWTDDSTETRALQKTTDGSRIAACWYSAGSFNVDFNFIDGASHKLTLYFLDWDRSGRSQTVEVLDAASGATLDSRSVSNFGDGTYLSWNVKGSIRVRITKNSGSNAVLMGLFFDGAGSTGGGGGGGSTGSNSKIVFAGGKMHVVINGQPGQKFDIYASENLKSWANVATVTLNGSSYDYVDDSSSTGKTLRFYRAVLAP